MSPGTYGHIHVKQLADDARGKPRFQARTRVRDQDGAVRQVSAMGGSKSKAEKALKDAIANRVTPASLPITANSRFRQLGEQWLEHVKARRQPTTYDTYAGVWNSIVGPQFGDLTIRELTGARVGLALANYSDRYSPNGVRQIKKVISGPLSLAVEWGVLERNPVKDLGNIDGGAKPARALNPDERRRLLKFVDTDKRAQRNDMGDLVRFLMGTGCRIGEALGLRWRDLDLDHSVAHINGSLIRVRGVGLMRRPSGKSRAADRRLTLPSSVVTALRARWDPREMNLESPVFPAGPGGWRDLNNVQGIMRYVREGTDLEWATTHTFRRTAALLLDEDGVSAREIANQLGHARPSMSQDVYMERSQQGPRGAASALDWDDEP